MNIDFYRTFLAVVHSKSFTRAAAMTNLSQSTISNRIQELEKYYDKKLFVRLNNSIELTSYGKDLIDYAEHIIALDKEALSHIKAQTDLKESIHIGSVHAYYQPHLKDYISNHLKNDSCLLQIDLRHSKDIIQGVVSGRYDLGISHHPCQFKMYQCQLLFKDDLVLVATKKHKGFESGITYDQLKTLPIYHTKLFDEHIESDLFKHLNYIFSIDVSDKVIDLVIDNESATFLPRSMVKKYLDNKQLYELPILDYELPPLVYYLICKEDHPLSHLIMNNHNKS